MPDCPTCGKDLTYIAQYDRWYCYAESKYASRDIAPAPSAGPGTETGGPASHDGHHHCPSCGKELTFIERYDRWYCYSEQKYAPRDVQPVGALAVDTTETNPAEEPTPQPAPIAEEPVTLETRPEPAPEPVAVEPEVAPVIAEPAAAPPEAEPTPEPLPADAAPTSELAPVETASVEPEPLPEGPKLKRSSVTKAKKAKLMEWCSAYGLDPLGTRVQLRDRLLAFMDDRRIDVADEEVAEEVPAVEETQLCPHCGGSIPLAVETCTACGKRIAPSVEAAPTAPPVEAVAPEPEPQPAPEPAPMPEPEPAPTPIPPSVPAEPSLPAVSESPAPEELPPETTPAVQEPEPAPQVEPSPVLPREPEPVSAPVFAPPIQEPAPVVEPTPTPTPLPVPASPVAAPVAPEPKVEVAKPLPCPTCGKELAFIAKYDRLYCYSCGNYAPKGYGQVAPAIEPTRPVVAEETKPAEPVKVVEVPTPAVAAPPEVKVEVAKPLPCPTCGRAMRYVKEYDRWWCDTDRKYAPKDYGRARNPCPSCGKELTFIKAYDRWYCHAEGKYAPKEYVAAAPTVTVTRVVPVAAAVPAVAAVSEARVVDLERAKHAHGRPGAGIALVAVGFGLMIVQGLVLAILPLLGVVLPVDFDPPDGQYFKILMILGFVGLVTAMLGTVAGLASLRRR